MDHVKFVIPFSPVLNWLVVLLLLVELLLVPVMTVHSAAGINLYISPGGTDSGNCQNPSQPCKTITYALGQAESGDTILLNSGIYKENLVINKSIRIAKNPNAFCPILIIFPTFQIIPCPTIDGNQLDRVIDITAPAAVVNLENIIVRNGKVQDAAGPGIRNVGTLTLDQVTILNNIVTFTDLNYPNNYMFRGGGIYNEDPGSLTIRDSSIHDNSAYDGGGIASAGSLTVIATEIYNNTAQRYGGGIDVPYGSPSTVENSTISSNTAQQGGGMFISSDGNSAHMGNEQILRNVTICNNIGFLSEGGLYSRLQVMIDHSTLALNQAPSYTDLRLYENQFSNGYPHSMITNTIISNPTAAGDICSIDGADGFDLSGGNNLSSDDSCDFNQPTDQQNIDPLLSSLADNGGRVKTMALPFGSSAIDHAGPFFNAADARGILSHDGNLDGIVAPDIGAFEYVPNQVYIPIVRK